jgi:2'-5' RNA ligase
MVSPSHSLIETIWVYSRWDGILGNFNKAALMSVIRAFIAIDLPKEIQECLEIIASQLKNQVGDVPVRWVNPLNIHLTLKFLGEVSLNNLEVLKESIRGEAVQHPPMHFSVGRVGAFPKIRNPRVIWIGVEAPLEMIALQRGIDMQTARIGYAPDDRPFSPHLTLGRVSHSAKAPEIRKIGEVLAASKIGFLGVGRVNAVHLYRSDLKPEGAVYTRLFSAPLQG